MNPCIAVIDTNTLSNIALKDILEGLFWGVEILTYKSVDAFIADSNRHFIHFFVGSGVLFANAGEFDMMKHLTIVLSNGPAPAISEAGYKVVDVSQDEKDLVSSILHLYEDESYGRQISTSEKSDELLSAREKEVLALIVKGYLNKEIADKLNISSTTVIFHRNNICDKLGTRSIGKLTIYAVTMNIVSLSEI